MSASLILHCPSKLNLTLKVLEKKKNGMHEIKSHFQLIDLCDVMHIEKSNAQQSSIRTNASIDIDSKKNLAYQAIEAVASMFLKSFIATLLLKKIFPLGEVWVGGALMRLQHLLELTNFFLFSLIFLSS